MTYELDAIYAEGMFRPLEPFVLPEGARVHLRVEGLPAGETKTPPGRLLSPQLVHPEQAGQFTMDVREVGDAGV